MAVASSVFTIPAFLLLTALSRTHAARHPVRATDPLAPLQGCPNTCYPATEQWALPLARLECSSASSKCTTTATACQLQKCRKKMGGQKISGYRCGCPKAQSPKRNVASTTQIPQKMVNVTMKYVNDDWAQIYIMGKKISENDRFDSIREFDYSGPCGDVMIRVTNHIRPLRTNIAAVALLATYEDQKYGTTDETHSKFGVAPIYAIAIRNPPEECFTDPWNCDFRSWTPAVVVDKVESSDRADDLRYISDVGAFPINVKSGPVDPGVYAVKFSFPFCYS